MKQRQPMTKTHANPPDQQTWELEELVMALELSQHGFMKFDAEARCTDMNDCAATILGRRRESWIGKTIVEVAPEAIGTPFEQAFQRCRRERRRIMVEREYYPPHQHWYQSCFQPTSRGAVILCFRDITDHVRREELEAELRHQARCREHFEGVLGHDLRNPLSTITCATAALIRAADLTEFQTRTIRRMAASAARMARMIDAILDLTRSRGGGELPIALQPVDLASVCRQGVDEAEIAHPTRKVELLLEGNTRGVWDRDRLAQVVSNLLGNALDYSPPSTPVRITARDEGARVVLEVHNQGRPIALDKSAEIFKPFQRGELEIVGSRPGGLGLGLFIAKLITEAHGGSIRVDSAADRGTTFTVSLPRLPWKLPSPGNE